MPKGSGPRWIYYPIILAITLALGMYIGSTLNYGSVQVASNNQVDGDGLFHKFSFPVGKRSSKLNDILDYIENEYVDSVSRDRLVDETIEHVLQELDPHSYYITAAELQAMNEPLEGKFEGIGVQFLIQKDTVVVISPVAGGPSEKAGILSGDRIVGVNGDTIAGNGITNNKVMTMLRGERGSEVNMSVYRPSTGKTSEFHIVRDQIPIYSVDVAYQLQNGVGYVKLSRFAKTTYAEFNNALKKLQEEDLRALVIDLRGNGGGFLETATNLVNEFLEEGRLIVYTEGRARKRETYYAHGDGQLTDVDLVVLIDEGSASASEILAGAVQDNDRGTIIGQRSFGKGLVQEQSGWPDGSATRLTIARYYTPTGRCIQKPYGKEEDIRYERFFDHVAKGNIPDLDSLDFPDSLIYHTPGGKTVYGGGGIIPDVYVKPDTAGHSRYLADLAYRNIISRFAFEYVDHHREALARFESAADFIENFDVSSALLEEFVSFAEEKGAQRDPQGMQVSQTQITTRLKAHIGRDLYNNDGFFPVLNTIDPVVIQALEILENQQRASEEHSPF